jgi:hypothetical protein
MTPSPLFSHGLSAEAYRRAEEARMIFEQLRAQLGEDQGAGAQ